MSEANTGKVSDEQIELREASEDDEDFLTGLYYDIRREEFAMVGWDETQIRQFLKMQYDYQKKAYRMQFPGSQQSIILFGREKVGRLIVDRMSGEFRLVNISLLADRRNLGIGTRIISDLMDEARARKLPLTLQVAVNNQSALRLYQNLGFRIIGQNEVNISMEWRWDFNL